MINSFEERIKKLEIDDIWKDERDFNQENRLDIIEDKLKELDEKLEEIDYRYSDFEALAEQIMNDFYNISDIIDKKIKIIEEKKY
tara:strand:- start:34 stop:288 length:255 start_codon:yes stop_codon:yes gene_type:complete